MTGREALGAAEVNVTYETVLVDSVAVALRVVVNYIGQSMRLCSLLGKQTYNLAHCDRDGHVCRQERRSGVSWLRVISEVFLYCCKLVSTH